MWRQTQYHAIKSSSERRRTSLPNTSDAQDLIAAFFDPGDCLDFMTCACILLPAEAVVDDDELSIVRTASYDSKNSARSNNNFNRVKSNNVGTDKCNAVSTASAVATYDLTPPIQFVASNPREYGLCPLGQEETI